MPADATTIAVLDGREARALTSREIAKILCAAIGAVLEQEPTAKDEIGHLLAAVKYTADDFGISDLDSLEAHLGKVRRATPGLANPLQPIWGLISGFRAWCEWRSVALACAWCVEHLDAIATISGTFMPPSMLTKV